MRFRISYGIAFGLLAALILVTGILFWRGLFQPGIRPRTLAETPAARLTAVRGDVMLTRGGAAPQAVESGTKVFSGDLLTTGDGSAATVSFFDGARAAIDANSSVRIETAAIDAANPRAQNVRVALLSGRVWSRILKLLDARSSYEVEVNGVVSGVRGTAFLVGVRGRVAAIDVFNETIRVSGKTSGAIAEGFGARIDTDRPPESIDKVLAPTPDATRNDSWVQQQLDLDALFARHAIDVRYGLGVEDPVAEYKLVQVEADSGVLMDPGAPHSDFQRVDVVSPNQQDVLRPDGSVALRAFAVFQRQNGEERVDVTDKATWQISHPDRAVVEKGVVRLVAADGASVVVVARWNDGTHQHSGALTLTIAQ